MDHGDPAEGRHAWGGDDVPGAPTLAGAQEGQVPVKAATVSISRHMDDRMFRHSILVDDGP